MNEKSKTTNPQNFQGLRLEKQCHKSTSFHFLHFGIAPLSQLFENFQRSLEKLAIIQEHVRDVNRPSTAIFIFPMHRNVVAIFTSTIENKTSILCYQQ